MGDRLAVLTRLGRELLGRFHDNNGELRGFLALSAKSQPIILKVSDKAQGALREGLHSVDIEENGMLQATPPHTFYGAMMMTLISRAVSALALTASVVTPLVSFAAVPSEAREGQRVVESQFGLYPGEAGWNND